MKVDVIVLKNSLQRICTALLQAAPELNALDGRLGDGDLGATLEKCATNVAALLPSMDSDISATFKITALACAKASGSSFGTLLSQALLVAAKESTGSSALSNNDVSAILYHVVKTLSVRGGAMLGDKTVLDPLNAVAHALQTMAIGENMREVAETAAIHTIAAFNDKPNKIGRARMFADRSIGMDDPGMIALLRIIEAA